MRAQVSACWRKALALDGDGAEGLGLDPWDVYDELVKWATQTVDKYAFTYVQVAYYIWFVFQ